MTTQVKFSRKIFLTLFDPKKEWSEVEAYLWILSREAAHEATPLDLSLASGWSAERAAEFLYRLEDMGAFEYGEGAPRPYPDSDSAVLLTERELRALQTRMTPLQLAHWIKVLNDYNQMNPTKFRKYKNHRAVIEQWERSELSRGRIWCENHPAGGGYYPSYQVERLNSAPAAISPPIPSATMGVFPKSE